MLHCHCFLYQQIPPTQFTLFFSFLFFKKKNKGKEEGKKLAQRGFMPIVGLILAIVAASGKVVDVQIPAIVADAGKSRRCSSLGHSS